MADKIIKVLDKEVASKIAAGEVVERPLSVVKELVENSIDAGATSIIVEIKAGGKEYIRVSDNGCGIERLQMNVAFKRYATSKIENASDLDSIETLGFRGEALASIAAVAKVGLTSKTAAAPNGACMHINGGQVKSIEDAPCENGTTFVVKNLFFNTPARLKFLKADNVEAALIIDFVSKAAIAFPNIAFQLISGGNILFATNGKGDLLNAIAIIYGPEIARNLVPVDYDDGTRKLTGYVSSPTINKTNKQWQTYFVNKRLVKSKALEDAISASYRDKLFKDQYPIVFLFLELPPNTVDVNVHPHKTEIRMNNEEDIKEFIVQSIRMALLNPNALNVTKFTKADAEITKIQAKVDGKAYIKEQAEEAKKAEEAKTAEKIVAATVEEKVPETAPAQANEPVHVVETTPQPSNVNIFKDANRPPIIEVQEEVETYNRKIDKFQFDSLTYIGQAFNTYLICKDEDNVYLVDQHAAHERVMYEKLLKAFNSEETVKQPIITPIVIDLSMSQKTAAMESIGLLNKMGFTIEEFGPSSFAAKEIPGHMNLREAERFLEQFFDAADEHVGNIQAKREVITSRACKAAVKAHDKLSTGEVSRLFLDLDKCKNPFSCPHGRPTFLRFSNYEIEKMFKRK